MWILSVWGGRGEPSFTGFKRIPLRLWNTGSKRVEYDHPPARFTV